MIELKVPTSCHTLCAMIPASRSCVRRLPPLFVAAMRFQFISLFACIFLAYRACERGWHGPGSERSSDHSVQGYHIQESASVHERGLLTAAAELAVIGLIGNFMTVWAVWRVQALTAEVLFGTIHIFVPLETLILGRLLGKSAHVGQRTWLGCAICMGAMMLLALSSAPVHVAAAAVVSASPSASRALGPIVIVCAMGLYGLGRVRAQHLVAEGGLDGETLNLWRMVLMGVASAVALLLSAVPPHSATRAILGALSSVRPAQYGFIALSCFLSAFAGSLLQFRGQRIIRAASAQPIYALSPLFAALWSCLLLDEPIAMHLLIAAAISVSGAILASTDPTAGVHSTPAPLDRRQCRRHSAHSE